MPTNGSALATDRNGNCSTSCTRRTPITDLHDGCPPANGYPECRVSAGTPIDRGQGHATTWISLYLGVCCMAERRSFGTDYCSTTRGATSAVHRPTTGG